jgi:hypothetical protein
VSTAPGLTCAGLAARPGPYSRPQRDLCRPAADVSRRRPAARSPRSDAGADRGAERDARRARKAFERARSLLPDVRAELWPEATHAITGEFSDEVNALVLDFLRRVDDRRSE